MSCVRLANSYRALVDIVADCVANAPWPLPAGTTVKVHVADVTWSTRNVSEFRSVGEVYLPYRFKSQGCSDFDDLSSLNCEGSADSAAEWSDDGERELIEALEEMFSDADDENACEVSEDEGARELSGEHHHVACRLAATVAMENPMLNPDEIIDEAAAVGASSDEADEAYDDEPLVEATPAPASSSSSSSSSETSSSAPSEEKEGESSCRLGRGAGRAPRRHWQALHCKRCGSVCGRIKYYNEAHVRERHYEMCVMDADGVFPVTGLLHKRRQVSKHHSRKACKSWAKRWVKAKRRCCPEP